MMPRQSSERNSSNAKQGNNSHQHRNNNNSNSNSHPDVDNTVTTRRRRSSSSNRASTVNEHIRQRHSQHGPGAAMAGERGEGAANTAASRTAAAAAMNEYPFSMSAAGRAAAAAAAGMGSFGHHTAPNSMAGIHAAAGMNAAAAMNMNMNNPAFLAAAGLPHHHHSHGHHQSSQQQQQQSLGGHLGVGAAAGDFRGAAASSGAGSGGMSESAAASNNPGTASSAMTQAEREEELLLNLLIARRQRAAMRGGDPQQPMGPAAASGGGGAGGNPGQATTWSEEFMRIQRDPNNAGFFNQQQQQQQEHLGVGGGMAAHMGAGGVENASYDGLQGDSSHSQISHHSGLNPSRMSMTGMNPFPNMNMNMVAGNSQHSSHFPSRLGQRGSGMVLQMGSAHGTWMAGNNPAATAAMMHSNPHSAAMAAADNSFAHQRTDMNAQVGLDVLERADRMMPTNMMHDARMAGADPTGQHHFGHYSSVGLHHGQDPMKEGAKPAKKKRSHKKKPADMPRRPLSAYNLFFSEERERILKEIEGNAGGDEAETAEAKTAEETDSAKKEREGEEDAKPKALLRPLLPSERKRRPHRKSHGKISFRTLAQMVGQRWKALPDDQRKYYQDLAQEDMKRQKKAMEEYYQKRSALAESETITKAKAK